MEDIEDMVSENLAGLRLPLNHSVFPRARVLKPHSDSVKENLPPRVGIPGVQVCIDIFYFYFFLVLMAQFLFLFYFHYNKIHIVLGILVHILLCIKLSLILEKWHGPIVVLY